MMDGRGAPTTDVTALALSRMLAPNEALIARVVERLRHLETIRTLNKTQTLTAEQASAALDVAFWASLGFNEGRATRTRLLFAEPELLASPVRFEVAVPYGASQVTRLFPAVGEHGCMGIAPSTMAIWGLHHSDPGSSLNALSLLLSAPGVVHVRIGPLRPYAVISNGAATILTDATFALADELRKCLRKSLTGDDIRKTRTAWRECVLLDALARQVLRSGHGGTLLLVPDAKGPWMDSVELAHRLAAPDATLREAALLELEGDGSDTSALRRVAPYAAVDGAVVITHDLDVVGFGAKIVVSKDVSPYVLVSGPQLGPQHLEANPIEAIGGTRHQSAARFVGANTECVAIIVSHDGHISLAFHDGTSVVVIQNVDWWD